MQVVKKDSLTDRFLAIVTILNAISVAFVLSIYASGGLFSRYLADDYCGSALLMSHDNFLAATFAGYQTWFNSYSRLFFMQLSDWAGLWGIRLFPAATLLFWTAGLTWLMVEIGRAIRIRMPLRVAFWLAGLAIFISLYQTPALYQILYWRTGVIPYTLPLVLFTGNAALLLWYVRQPVRRSGAVWAGVLFFLLAFFAGGLSETTSAFQAGLLFVAVVTVWLTRSLHGRTDVVLILAAALLAAVLALLLTAFSPGTTARLDRIMNNPPLYNPFVLSVPVITYTAQFLWDNLKVTPLPILIALLVPFALVYVRSFGRDAGLPRISTRQLWLVILILLLLMFVVIGFSFAPSAFARTYPAARARFASHFMMNFSLILAGGMLGVLASRIRLPFPAAMARSSALVLLGVLCLYPWKVSSNVVATFPEYRYFAQAWDARDASIRQAIAEGATDLVVVQLDSIGGVGEYKGSERDWINRCAARFYGLNTLRAP
jgi:hypothetical protein